MAHLKSAIKRMRTSREQNARNRARKSTLKTVEKKFRAAVAAGDAAAADRGADAYIGNGGVYTAVNNGAAGINTKFWHHDTRGDHEIRRGDAQRSAQLFAVDHHTAQYMGVSQKAGGRFHIALLDQRADISGGNALSAAGLLRHNDAGKPIGFAERIKPVCIAFAAMTKAEIVAADKTNCALCHQLLQKSFPWS